MNNTVNSKHDGRKIPRRSILTATPIAPNGTTVEWVVMRNVQDGYGRTVEGMAKERWMVWGALAWPFENISEDGRDGYCGAAACLAERMDGDAPDGLSVILDWSRFTNIERDGFGEVEGSAKSLHGLLSDWNVKYGLSMAFYPEDEKCRVYVARLCGCKVAPCPVKTNAAEAEYLISERLLAKGFLWDATAEEALSTDFLARPSPLRRALRAGMVAREMMRRY